MRKRDVLELEERVAIVTGGSRGIGRAIANALAREGAKLVIADLEPSKDPGNSEFVETDVGDEVQVKHLMDYVLRTHKKIDILCNNAGIELAKPITETTEKEWDRVLNTNLKGTFLCSKHALPSMIGKKSGAIVNTASQLGIVGLSGYSAYCASKGGVILFTKSMALEYAKFGIRVNCVCPGAIDTSMVEREAALEDDPNKARQAMISKHPLGRLGRPEEVAQAVLYLASDRSTFVTGEVLVVDGGYVIQ